MDAMVTARMPQGKKDAGNRVLDQLGTNASAAVNDLYTYLIENRALPFAEKEHRHYTAKEIEDAANWVDSLALPPGNRFSTMTDREVKIERLISRGLLDPEDAK